jgi:hypothetical protein
MDSSLFDDGMMVGETFCTEYRLNKAKARILAMDTIITPVMSFAEVMSQPVILMLHATCFGSNSCLFRARVVLCCRLCLVKHLSRAQ